MSRKLIACCSLFSLVLALPIAAQPPAASIAPQAAGQVGAKAGDSSLMMVPTDSFFVVSVKISKLWDNPAAKPVRDWVSSQKEGTPLDNTLGVPLAEIDRLTAFTPTLSGVMGRQPLFVILRTRQPYNEARVLKSLGVDKQDGREQQRLNGRVMKIDGEFSKVAFLDEQTLLLISDARSDETDWSNLVVQLMVRKTDGPLAATLMAANDHDVTVGLDIKELSTLLGTPMGFPTLPKELIPYQILLNAKSATLTADFAQDAKCSLALSFPDAATAKRAGPVLDEGIKDIVKAFANDPANQPDGPDGMNRRVVDKGLFSLMTPWFSTVLKKAKVTVNEANVVAISEAPFQDELAKVVAVLPKSMSAARHTSRAINNLKQLGLGALNYESTYGIYPSDVFNIGNNKSIAMSWRVQILPFIEQQELYNKLSWQVSWDDPANLKVLESLEMPKVFEIPGREAPKGHTYFRIFKMPKDAKGTELPLLKEGEIGPRIISITDGTSNTFLIVEAGEAVPWYKPDLLAYDGKLPLPQLGDKNADRFLACFCDGSVRTLRPSKLGENTLRALITINGGEVIQLDR